ncbi:hypothetical protein KR200_001361, partial [Drosophila serrata]
EFAINNSVQCSTGKTPSVLLFGCEQRGPMVDELTEYLENKLSLTKPRCLDTVRDEANNRIRQSQIRNESAHRLRHKAPPLYDVGDFVAIRNVDVTSGHCKKFTPMYRGPNKINRVFTKDRYEVTDIDNCQLTQLPYKGILEAVRLKTW